MLVLSRRHNEKILLPSVGASIEVLEIKGDRVRLGIDAPANVTILREELADKQGLRSIADMRAAVEAATLEAREQRHLLRNQLNTATVGIAVARRQLEAGLIEQVAATLSKIGDGVQLLGEFQAGSFAFDHRDDRVQVARRPLEPFDDLRMRFVDVMPGHR